MPYHIPYGKSELVFDLPGTWQVDTLVPPAVPGLADPLAAVEQALDAPLGGVRLEDWRGVSSAAVAINDKTRPVPHHHLLPPLLRRLEALGLPPESVTLLVATGAHAPMPEAEFGLVLPADLMGRVRIASHNCDAPDLVPLGETSRGTPVLVNPVFHQAGLRIVVGSIEPHQFEGFSGGVKSAAIGLAGRETINTNHAMMAEPGAELGAYAENPARQDVEEIGEIMGVDFALNAVLNLKKEIAGCFAGAPRAVMEAGIPLALQVHQTTLPAPYDLVIASPGGHPKDINLYQAQKALANAVQAARPGGVVVLAAACPEGAGSRGYEDWVLGIGSFEEVFARFRREGFRIGPHKAWQIARDASRVRAFLVSDMAPDFVRRLLLAPAAGVAEALGEAGLEGKTGLRVALMPYAASGCYRAR